MLFNSLRFLLFFPLVCLVYFLFPKRVRWVWLLGASYVYYMSWNPKYALLLAGATAVSWLCGILLEVTQDPRKRRLIIAVGVLIHLAALFVFKYFRFGLSILNRVLRTAGMAAVTSEFHPLLPVGISFYLLQSISYIIDVSRGKLAAERNFFKYALYVAFFPQLLAGPIGRARELLPQITAAREFDFDRVKRGLWLMLWGYIQKLVIADRLGLMVDTVYANPTYYSQGGTVNWVVMFLFAFQVYLDFAGYSNVAVGAAEVLGYRLTRNFERPFFAGSITELWTRWHISLSRWFIDYLYIPLGGNRCSKPRWYFNLMVVFLTSGLWHGANWTYLIWGGLNGIYSVTERALLPVWCKHANTRRTKTTGWKCLQFAYVLLLFSFSTIFFRAESLAQALEFIRGLAYFSPEILFNGQIFNYGLDRVNFFLALLGLGLVFWTGWNQRDGSLRSKIEAQPLPVRWALILCGIFVLLLFGIYGPGFNAANFIYLQF